MKTAALLCCAALLAGCAGSGRESGRATVFAPDPYARLAERISDGHRQLSNNKVAVLPFPYADKRLSSYGAVISERLLTRIINKGELQVIERGLLEKVLSELKLQRSGLIDESSIKGLGKILGVEAIVTGTLTRRKDGRVEVNARLIKTENASVITAAAEMVPSDWDAAAPELRALAVSAPAPAGPAPQSPPAGIPSYPARVDRTKCPAGLVAYWNFNEDSAPQVLDVFGRNNGRAYGTSRAAGISGAGLELRKGDYVEFGDPAALNQTRAVTVLAWIRFRTNLPYESGTKIFCAGSVNYCFAIGGSDNTGTNLAVYMDGVTTAWVRGVTQLSPNEWYFAAFTYNGSNIRTYLNGSADAAIPASGAMRPSAPGGLIGFSPLSVPGYRMPLDGFIDEVAVFGRALDPDEIFSLYRKGSAGRGYCS